MSKQIFLFPQTNMTEDVANSKIKLKLSPLFRFGSFSIKDVALVNSAEFIKM